VLFFRIGQFSNLNNPQAYYDITEIPEGSKWLETLSWHPRVFFFHNLISKEYCEDIMFLLVPQFELSKGIGVKFELMEEVRINSRIKELDRDVACWSQIPVSHSTPFVFMRIGLRNSWCDTLPCIGGNFHGDLRAYSTRFHRCSKELHWTMDETKDYAQNCIGNNQDGFPGLVNKHIVKPLAIAILFLETIDENIQLPIGLSVPITPGDALLLYDVDDKLLKLLTPIILTRNRSILVKYLREKAT